MVVVQLEVLLDHPSGGVELVLIGPTLDGRQPIQLLLAVLELLGGLYEEIARIFPRELQHHYVNHPSDTPIGLSDQRGLTLDELLREVGQGLERARAPRAGVQLVLLQEFVQLFLLQTDRRIHEGGEVLVAVDVQLDALRRTPRLSHPLISPRLAALAEGKLRRSAGETKAGQDRLIGRRHLPADDFFSVHGLDAWVGRRILGLLIGIDGRCVPLDLAVAEPHHALGQTLSGLQCALERQLEVPGQRGARGDLALLQPVGDVDKVLGVRAGAVQDPNHDDVNSPNDMLVLRRIKQQPGRTVLDLCDELVEALRLSLAEAVNLHVVIQQLLLDGLVGHLKVDHVASRHRLALRGGRQHVRHAAARPPLERGAPLCDQVHACEGLVTLVANNRGGPAAAALVLCRLQPVDQFGAALLNAGVRACLLDVGREVGVHALDGHARGLAVLIREELVLQRIGALLALGLVALEQRVDELVALGRAPLGDDQLLELDVLLAFEGELA
mmetsp:Transcript_117297/g.328307  ORF Transcript_117297/g.328307 Transcript_117297/m.328307 type:complete len:500 (-) Transcript_117297:217-1716(-)